MPDRDAMDLLCNMQGEESMRAAKLRQESHRLHQMARDSETLAMQHEQRAGWYAEAITALGGGED